MLNCPICAAETPKAADFGYRALAGGFMRDGEWRYGGEVAYALGLSVCDACGFAQVSEPVAADKLFSNYFYRSSASRTTARHLADCADELVARFRPRTALEIGSNDATLLRRMCSYGVQCVGVDPSGEPGPLMRNQYFTSDSDLGKFDLIVANNVLAHVEDVNDFMAGVAAALEYMGVFAFELHYLPKMLQTGQWDWVYHEHRYYYSVRAVSRLMEKHGLRLIEVHPINAHGGSMRYIASRERLPNASPGLWLRSELGPIAGKVSWFAAAAQAAASKLSATVSQLQRAGLRVAGYGASGRASMILQAAGLDLDYVVDDTPGKQGHFMPMMHTPIYGPERLESDQPDVIVVLAWPYLGEILKKIGDLPVVIPLPDVEVLWCRKVAA